MKIALFIIDNIFSFKSIDLKDIFFFIQSISFYVIVSTIWYVEPWNETQFIHLNIACKELISSLRCVQLILLQ